MTDDPFTVEHRRILSQSSLRIDGKQAQVVGSPYDDFAQVRCLSTNRIEWFDWELVRTAALTQTSLISAAIPEIPLQVDPDLPPPSTLT